MSGSVIEYAAGVDIGRGEDQIGGKEVAELLGRIYSAALAEGITEDRAAFEFSRFDRVCETFTAMFGGNVRTRKSGCVEDASGRVVSVLDADCVGIREEDSRACCQGRSASIITSRSDVAWTCKEGYVQGEVDGHRLCCGNGGVGKCNDRIGRTFSSVSLGIDKFCDQDKKSQLEDHSDVRRKLSPRQKKRVRQRQNKDKDWRSKDGGDMIEQDQSPGTFWNSTSVEVRQRLIDSKAKMHIAENEKREREARERIAYLESPEAAMHKAIGMIDYAQKQAKKENDNKVYGWAKTVATSSAESLARSTPDSVPSFDEVSARIEASSQSSFELELKAKQDELDDERRKVALLENEVREEKKAKEEVVAKSKHEAVVHRMRQLETQISENNKKAERVNFRRNRVEEMRNAQGETEKQMRARMAKLSPEEHQREVVRLMRERAWENS